MKSLQSDLYEKLQQAHAGPKLTWKLDYYLFLWLWACFLQRKDTKVNHVRYFIFCEIQLLKWKVVILHCKEFDFDNLKEYFNNQQSNRIYEKRLCSR